MKFLVVAASLLAPTFVAGQLYGGGPVASSPAPTPSAAPGQTIITVAENNGLMFTPGSITAKVGQNVTFMFSTASTFNHSVSQSSFSDPCTKLKGGFDTGLQAPGQEFTITITNASEPIWFFCEQTIPVKHCGMGMVGAINPPTSGSDTIGAFSSAALSVGNNEATQTGSLQLLGVGASATAGPTAQPGTSASSAERLWIGVGTIFCVSLGFVACLL